jgi:hypothetical protein
MDADVAIGLGPRVSNPSDAKVGLLQALLNADDLTGFGYAEQVAQARPIFGYVDCVR